MSEDRRRGPRRSRRTLSPSRRTAPAERDVTAPALAIRAQASQPRCPPGSARFHGTLARCPGSSAAPGGWRALGDSGTVGPMPTALVIGARNLGFSVIERLLADGWTVSGSARSEQTLERVRSTGADALEIDVTDQASVLGALRAVADRHGRVDLAVNAAAPYGGGRSGPFGGGALAEAAPSGFEDWSAMPVRGAFAFLSASARFLTEQGGEKATIVQVTGGSSRRAMPGRGLWAAGAFGVRALTQAAALELRGSGIHVALLIVDAGIQPPVGTREGVDPATLADPHEIAEAVRFLGEQGARAATHELQVTPLGERWVP